MAEEKKAPTVPTWIYPLDGSAGKIVELEVGAKPPKGFRFEPVEPAQDDDKEG